MLTQIRLYIYGVGAALLTLGAALLYRKGAYDAKKDMWSDDYEHAEEIRRRVSRNRDDRVRELDDAGWRD
jgi:hypothetical protein